MTVVDGDGMGGCQLAGSGPNNMDVFYAKLKGTDGTCLWARGTGDSELQAGNAVAIDGANNVFLTGYFRNSGRLRPGHPHQQRF